jgi:hypothetical protein
LNCDDLSVFNQFLTKIILILNDNLYIEVNNRIIREFKIEQNTDFYFLFLTDFLCFEVHFFTKFYLIIMHMQKFRISLFALLLSSVFLFSCGGKKKAATTETTTTTTTDNSSTAAEEMPKEEEIEGGALNKFFPKEEGAYKVVYNQEKDGFVQASLEQDGKEVATLAVSDLSTNMDTKAKYEQSTMKVGSYPSLKKGSKGTTILVGDRYQVSIRSKDDSFNEDMRKAWFEKFDLSGLANLK